MPVRRSSAVLVAAAGLVLLGAGPALAHVEVTAQGTAQAGTGPVTLLFSAAAESTTSGIVGVRTQLPAGIEPGAVSLASAPQGWALAPIEGGFELSGPATVPGEDLEYGVTVALLPADATELAFPTVQRYADGREDAWIEPVTDAVPDPEMPAPALAVAPAPPGGTPSATPAPAPATTDAPAPTTAARTSDAAGAGAPEDGGIGTGTVVLLGVLAGAVAVTAGVVLRRRGRSS